ncbi:MAG: TMEM43 family protein [Chloroflexota bacterium]
MDAWSEQASSQSTQAMSGDQERTTTYSYRPEWAHQPEDSSRFKDPAGHANPRPALSDGAYRATSATVGANVLDSTDLALPSTLSVTAFGQLRGHALAPYDDGSGHQLYGIYAGERDDALGQFTSQHTESAWVFRLVRFLVMFLGVWILFAPILTLLVAITVAMTYHRRIAPVVLLAGSLDSHRVIPVAVGVVLVLALVAHALTHLSDNPNG